MSDLLACWSDGYGNSISVGYLPRQKRPALWVVDTYNPQHINVVAHFYNERKALDYIKHMDKQTKYRRMV